MDFDTLFDGLAVRHATDSARDTVRHQITDVITSPETGCENAIFVATKTPISNGRYALASAYARGCRLFLCASDAYVGEDATVMICDDPEQLLGMLASRVYGHPAREMTVIGITGSAGKSSVAQMTAQALQRAGRRVGVLDTDGIRINGVRTPPSVSAPDAADIHRTLAKMAGNGVEIAILEFSSYQLLHHAAEGMPFAVVAMTNFFPRHIGRREHPDVAAYRAAKERLMRAPCAFAVLPVGEEMACGALRTFRVGEGGDLWAERAQTLIPFEGVPTTALRICEEQGNMEITLPVIGDMGVQNALFAAALCRAVGLSQAQVATALSDVGVQGRMECLLVQRGRMICRDSAFCAEDLAVALSALRPLTRGRLCVLLGSVGGRAKERRLPLGRTACALADFVYLTADDPDGEDPAAICEEMLHGMEEPARALILTDRRAAIARSVAEMREGDVLLILAKTHGAWQLVQGRRLPFDERAEVSGAFGLI